MNKEEQEQQLAQAERTIDWLDFAIERGYVVKSESEFYAWSVPGLDFMARQLRKSDRYSADRDPQIVTPVVYFGNLAKSIDVETAKVFGGWQQ